MPRRMVPSGSLKGLGFHAPRRPALIALFVLAAGFAGGLSGCATYGGGMQAVLDPLRRGDPKSALRRLEEHPRGGDALFHLERGLLLRLLGGREASNQAFDAASEITEELHTLSLSREAASLAVTDRIRPYRMPPQERILARCYQVCNYLESRDLEGALVEVRRLGVLLEATDEEAARLPMRGGGLLADLLSALVFEAAGQPDEALVCYRRLWRSDGSKHHFPSSDIPEWAFRHALSLARRVGLDLSGELDSPEIYDPPAGECGFTAVVLVEHGLVPPRREIHLRVPILKDEEGREAEDRASSACDRALHLREDRGISFRVDQVAYWLDVALPTYQADLLPPPPIQVVGGEVSVMAKPVADLAAMARAQLEREMPSIVGRSIIRSLAKYAAHKEARRRGGEFGGVIANLFGVATEQAETRSWLSLPSRIDLAVLDLREPVETVEIDIDAGAGSRSASVALTTPRGRRVGFGFVRLW